MVCLGPLPPSVDVRIPCRPDWRAVGHGPGRTSACLKIWAWTVVTTSGTRTSLSWSLLFPCQSTLSPKRQVAHAILHTTFLSLPAPSQKVGLTGVRDALALPAQGYFKAKSSAHFLQAILYPGEILHHEQLMASQIDLNGLSPAQAAAAHWFVCILCRCRSF